MRSAYNEEWLYNLALIKEAKRWWKHGLVSDDQFAAIKEGHKSHFYHPNFIIRILLFIATLIALSGVSGIFFLMVGSNETALSIAAILYGVGSFFFLKEVFIRKNNHYKSGVTEALLYHAIGFTIGGILGLMDFNIHVALLISLLVCCFAAIRYLDLVCTVAAIICFASLVFYEFYNVGGIFQQIIPFIFILVFTPVYFAIRRLKTHKEYSIWSNSIVLVESASLLFIYLAGNYLVVRELSINMMDLALGPGDDIPFAMVFYGLTVLMPIAYLYFGIRNKDVVLLRVSLVLIAFSVFTFKYYYGFGHPEISLTIAGTVVLAISLVLFNYLKTTRNGFTRENLLAEKWGDANIQAIIISQTLGGNQVAAADGVKPGGGEFSGGGASDNF